MPFKRAMVTNLVSMCGKLVIVGGDAGDAFDRTFENDVWLWDGEFWVRQCEHAPWQGRLWNAVVVYDNKLWLCAGRVELELDQNDLWYSEDLGRTWVQSESPWVQTHADGVDATEEGGIVMASGFGSDKTVCRVIKN